jgi:hypothetical protein
MLRCNNCGWENPNENASCEKCGATLTAWTGEQPAVGTAPTESLNARRTAIGCPKCGYPLRPADTCCPNCNAPVQHSVNRPDDKQEKPAPTLSPFGGTVIATTSLPGGEKNVVRRLSATLVTYSIHPEGDIFPIVEGKNFIGRDATANICVPSDTKMSERHLSILYRAVDKKFKFKDEQSSNGTFINECLTDEGELNSGDIIRAGDTKFLFIAIPEF